MASYKSCRNMVLRAVPAAAAAAAAASSLSCCLASAMPSDLPICAAERPCWMPAAKLLSTLTAHSEMPAARQGYPDHFGQRARGEAAGAALLHQADAAGRVHADEHVGVGAQRLGRCRVDDEGAADPAQGDADGHAADVEPADVVGVVRDGDLGLAARGVVHRDRG